MIIDIRGVVQRIAIILWLRVIVILCPSKKSLRLVLLQHLLIVVLVSIPITIIFLFSSFIVAHSDLLLILDHIRPIKLLIEWYFKLIGRTHVVLLLSVVYTILGFEISHLDFFSAILKRKCILIELLNLLVLGFVHRSR